MTKKQQPKVTPLYNLEAERSVLGAMINGVIPMDELATQITPESFTHRDHQEIFKIGLQLYRAGTNPDLVTISDRCTNDATLTQIASSFYPGSVRAHLETVQDLAIRRQVQQQCSMLHESMNDKARTAGELLDDAQKEIGQIALGASKEAGADINSSLHEVLDDIDQSKGNNVTGVPTGYRDLDHLTSGLHPTNLIILAARPRMGKTALASNLLINAAAQGYPCAMFSLEMSRMQLIKRMLAQISKVDFQHIRNGYLSDQEYETLHYGAENLSKLDIWIDDSTGLTSYDIKSRTRKLAQKRGIKLLVVDYLTKIKLGRKTDTRDQAVTEIASDLKDLAKEINIPVLCLAQLNRQCDSRKNPRPVLSDLRESGGIEQEADDILFIYREAVYKENCGHNKAEIIMGKQRNGPEGMAELAFLGNYVSFEGLER
ncbi:MAG: replicative DNA helicase [Desulfovermiculus sp.]